MHSLIKNANYKTYNLLKQVNPIIIEAQKISNIRLQLVLGIHKDKLIESNLLFPNNLIPINITSIPPTQ